MTSDGDPTVQILDVDDCVALLVSDALGRIAWDNGLFPMILPVNYVWFDGLVVLRTDVGLKLANVPLRPVAFEIDGSGNGAGWSVVVLGYAREVTTALGPRYEALRASQVPIVAPGAKSHWLAIEPHEISGRRFPIRLAEPAPPEPPAPPAA